MVAIPALPRICSRLIRNAENPESEISPHLASTSLTKFVPKLETWNAAAIEPVRDRA